MIEKEKLSVKDLKDFPLGAVITYRLPNGAAILTARNIISYARQRYALKFLTEANFVTNTLTITRIR